ncbi:hypothetical protein BCV70DRAFT_202119 [Testicularia cyperi]|uniref:Phosphatidic acid phosphatase type 2/haloperoxidase domain-containing protein n=1 Tax=Testicularia cyperi TaxID=1882483 RepID=A0A317XLS6_9BASI|nr:hypothetical protein BCV70DRAFT_202119 [Testicularia cyperi]
MAPQAQHVHQRRAHAVREASTSSIEDDRKISGSWLGGQSSALPSSNHASASTSRTPSTAFAPAPATSEARKPLSVDTSAATESKPKNRGHVQKQEKIERIGLLRGSSHVGPGKDGDDSHQMTTSIGLQDDAVYDAYLPRPVALLRRLIVGLLRKEAPIHARHQKAVRRPWLDRYFVNTSLLGTHSFFLVFLPMVFWLGSPRFGRGLINVLAFGVYFSSAIKDLFCVPRPYSPPVTRLTIGTHHLEYGFPSTHSTNSVSIALYIYLWVRQFRHAAATAPLADVLASAPGVGSSSTSIFESYLWEAGLLFYACSVVYGRIYAGMHSITDCIAGSALGAGITWVQWHYFDHIEDFIKINSWSVPLAIIPAGLLMVSVHPPPVDDCPCFEDAIAFVSVAMGVALARWAGIRYDITLRTDPINHAFAHLGSNGTSAQLLKMATPALDAALKTTPLIQLTAVPAPAAPLVRKGLVLVIGLVNVLLLRVIVKTICKVVLPPTFRFVDKLIGFSLPRRHYTQAKDYNNIPLADLSAVPSVLDLPSQIIVTDEKGNQHSIQSSPVPGSPVSGPSRQSSLDIAARTGAGRTALSPVSGGGAASLFSRSPTFGSPIHSPVPSRTPSPNPIEMRRNPNGGGVGVAAKGRGLAKSPAKKIQFTLGGPVNDDNDDDNDNDHDAAHPDLPIPLTQSKAHPNFVPPDEKLARHIAADIVAPSGDTNADKEVKHYDADVLTKVIVYGNIGLFSAGLIPALFESIGLSG